MIERVILLMMAALFVRLGLLLVDLALTPARELKLSLFRPCRGDPWPIGVQEDDDLASAGARPRRGGGRGATARAIADREARRHAGSPMAAGATTIEDLPVGTVATQRPDRVTVHRARH